MTGEQVDGASGRASETGAVEMQLVHAALSSLDRTRVAYRVRKPLTAGAEVDIWLDSSSRRDADLALRPHGFHVLVTPHHREHRFYLAFDRGRWLKVDAKLEQQNDTRTKRMARRAANLLGRFRPASVRRLGPIVAVLGPDGAGKGSVIRELQNEIPIAVTAVYLGRTPRRSRGIGPRPRRRRPAGPVRECAFVVRNYLHRWPALLRGYAAAWRGDIVLFDRHPIEVLAVRPERSPFAGRLERLLVCSFTPWPDAIVVLDAPARTLLERKGEHSVEVLERWRAGYRDAFAQRAKVVATVGPLHESVSEASAVIWEAMSVRRRWAGGH